MIEYRTALSVMNLARAWWKRCAAKLSQAANSMNDRSKVDGLPFTSNLPDFATGSELSTSTAALRMPFATSLHSLACAGALGPSKLFERLQKAHTLSVGIKCEAEWIISYTKVGGLGCESRTR